MGGENTEVAATSSHNIRLLSNPYTVMKKRVFLSLVFFWLLAVLPLSVFSQKTPAAIDEEVDAYIQLQMKRQHIPGLALAVLKNGKIVKIKGYGLANMEDNAPVTPETVYKLASVSKQFIASGIMVLQQDGKLNVDDRISKYVDSIPGSWSGITIRHLLTHTSGLIRESPAFDAYESQPLLYVIKQAFNAPVNSAPGEKWSYCNLGYYLLAAIIEKSSGQAWDAFISERIFKPSGMTQTRATTVSAIVPHRAGGYNTIGTGWENAENFIAVRPSGAFISSISDMAKWESMLYTGKVLTETSKQQMWTPAVLNNGAGAGYGFGWGIDSINKHKRVSHDGSLSGFRTHFGRYPDDKIAVIVLTSNGGANPSKIGQRVAGTYVPALMPQPAPALKDTSPDVTLKVKAFVDAAMSNRIDTTVFAASLLTPDDRMALSKDLSDAGTPLALTLTGRWAASNIRGYNYRLDYNDDYINLIFEFDREGKISYFSMN